MKAGISTRIARALGATAVASLGVLLLSPRLGTAQAGADLRNLIFEPVPLAAATESTLDLEPSAPVDNRALSNTVQRQSVAIESLRRSGSEAELIEQLGLLAVAYQGLERHQEALEALDEAIALTVAAGGRDNPQQIPLQEQKIPSHRALDDVASIDETEELIYSLKAQSLPAGGRDMYYATMDLADWNTTAYYKENYGFGDGLLSRQRAVMPSVQRCIMLPGRGGGEGATDCLEGPIFSGDIREVSSQDIVDPRLSKIDRLYADYQAALFDGGNVQLDIVIDLAKRVARLAYATRQEMDFERDNHRYDPNYDGSREQAARNSARRMEDSYDSGVKALEHAISIPSSVASFRPEALAAALLDLGDWHLAYGKVAAAEDVYREAYQVLLDAGFASANIDRALATEMPARVPVFATHLYSRRSRGLSDDTPLDYAGYVDVGYTVDRLGNARDVRFLGSSRGDSSEIEKVLEIQLRSMKFRPELRGGDLHSPGRIEARYYFSY